MCCTPRATKTGARTRTARAPGHWLLVARLKRSYASLSFMFGSSNGVSSTGPISSSGPNSGFCVALPCPGCVPPCPDCAPPWAGVGELGVNVPCGAAGAGAIWTGRGHDRRRSKHYAGRRTTARRGTRILDRHSHAHHAGHTLRIHHRHLLAHHAGHLHRLLHGFHAAGLYRNLLDAFFGHHAAGRHGNPSHDFFFDHPAHLHRRLLLDALDHLLVRGHRHAANLLFLHDAAHLHRHLAHHLFIHHAANLHRHLASGHAGHVARLRHLLGHDVRLPDAIDGDRGGTLFGHPRQARPLIRRLARHRVAEFGTRQPTQPRLGRTGSDVRLIDETALVGHSSCDRSSPAPSPCRLRRARPFPSLASARRSALRARRFHHLAIHDVALFALLVSATMRTTS